MLRGICKKAATEESLTNTFGRRLLQTVDTGIYSYYIIGTESVSSHREKI